MFNNEEMHSIRLFVYFLNFLAVRSETLMDPFEYQTDVNERFKGMNDILLKQAALIENHSKRIQKLEDIVDNQNSVIQIQRKNFHDQADRIEYLQNDLKNQVNQIYNLENTVHDQRNEIITLTSQLSVIRSEQIQYNATTPKMDLSMTAQNVATLKPNLDSDRKIWTVNYEVGSQYKRLSLSNVIQASQDQYAPIESTTGAQWTIQAIAFYAYLSHNEYNPPNGKVVVFETEKTNTNGVYNKYSGMFTVPIDGIYGFIYTLRMSCNRANAGTIGAFELVKNSEVEGSALIFDKGCDLDTEGQITDTANVIIHANKGDIVFIRTHTTFQLEGHILSDANGKSSFSGWLIGIN